MKSIIQKVMFCLLVTAIASPSVFADNTQKKHKRRHQVVNRANREENANNAAAVNGKITDSQAKRLDNQDQHIKKEERRDAAANGGHITKTEQQNLNRQENQVNRERSNMEKRDANGGPVPAGNAPAQPAAPETSN